MIRAVIVIAISIAVTVPAVVYVGVTLSPLQKYMALAAEKELSELLGAQVDIGSVSVAPFNRASLRDVSITLDAGRDSVLHIDRLGAGINLYELTVNRKIIINYVELVGLKLSVHRDSVGTPLNIQPIIDRLIPESQSNPVRNINLAINTVILRDAEISYDVDSIPQPSEGVFSPDHVMLYDFSADLRLPAVGNAGQVVEVKRFKVKERSGLEITDFKGNIAVTPDSLAWRGVSLRMPRSLVEVADCRLLNARRLPLDSLLFDSRFVTGITSDSYITPSDLAPIVGQLKDFTDPVIFQLDFDGILRGGGNLAFTARTPHRDVDIQANSKLSYPLDTTLQAITDVKLSAKVDSHVINRLLPLYGDARRVIGTLGLVDLELDGSASRKSIETMATMTTAKGSVEIAANLDNLDGNTPRYDVDLNVVRLDVGSLLQLPGLDVVSFDASATGRLVGARPNGELELNIDRLDWQGHPLGDISAMLVTSGKKYELNVDSQDPAARFRLKADGSIDKRLKSINLASRFDFIDLGEIFPGNKLNDCTLQFAADADLKGASLDDITGLVNIHNLKFDRSDGNEIVLKGIAAAATTNPDGSRTIDFQSDIISGEAHGAIFLSTLGSQLAEISFESLPSLKKLSPVKYKKTENEFTYAFKLHDTEQWADALKFPVSNLGESDIYGGVNYLAGSMSINIDAPYLRQGNKLIETTRIEAGVDGITGRSKLYVTSRYPTKHGPLKFDFGVGAVNDSIDSHLTWAIDRAARYDGNISVDAVLERYPSGPGASITVNPGELTFNDSTWTINRATVDVEPGQVVVNGINAHRSGQFIKIEGRASHMPDDAISIDLLGVNLDYIFESLGIDKVMLGGDATGCFYASSLYTSEPRFITPGLAVKDISYNKVVLGDAIVKSGWDGERRAITLDAVVDQANGKSTLIDGAIFPLNDSLDITFDAHDVDVAFMYPYMKAFTSDISGRASGVARLWGNFKYIDMEGDIVCDSVMLKVDFTNTSYFTNDSIKLRKGEISLDNVTVSDIHGNTARLDGKVWHKFFKEPVFDFNITDVRNMLVYDETSRRNPDWYGSIYGNGSAHIDGRPGVVNINVDMSTAQGSVFNFVLNDTEEASDYSFITFRDRDLLALGEREVLVDDTPSTVRRLRAMLARREEESSSDYNIGLMVDINPNTQINLIMDPVGGDRIRSWGSGSMRMSYGSSNNELHMYGTYTLDRGNYNFTLQDIIIKDFTIKSGSSITFSGDPFTADLDIRAAYPLTANLSDLDESFLQDKDLNRTTVPVNAILQVSGVMQQPDIDFDLEFPTLTQDTYRKVKSIVSTKDMMNRQIIYLLALGRFYTPDYMATSNRGNELASVASSTISSQLGNILGSLSDNWNIAPTFRSDRGDFSDVEVDVALSSSLLNNRLLFNGNFGYRDKSLNNTQFVGDFDIEYLLNRAGTLRLKAYNRYNDQNYYVRTAETTQGVGVSFRRNFDSFTDLLRRHVREERRAANDSITR